jgi:hypothetical protein
MHGDHEKYKVNLVENSDLSLGNELEYDIKVYFRN